MRLIRFFFVCIACCFIINKANAQQNLFNIPSGDITNQGKFFYQHQLNVYSNKFESKAHFVRGFGKGWDGGINVVGKGAYFDPKWRVLHNDNPAKGAVYPIVMATVQKQFHLNDHISINVGSQLGANLSGKVSNKELNFFNYGLGIMHFAGDRGRVVVGGYHTNKMYVGEGNTVGVMAGYEFRLSKRWYLMGDWVSGKNDAAVSVIGGIYNVSKRIQLCAGWQIPNPRALKPQGLVLEFNWMGWDLF